MKTSVPDVRFWAEQGGLLLRGAREAASLNQAELADACGTSRTTLSAYEHGRKSPTLETAGRILDAAGFRLALEPKVEFTAHPDGFWVPDRLPRLRVEVALGRAEFPAGHWWNLADRADRQAAYSAVLCDGSPGDITRCVDGVLLAELWAELSLPPPVQAAWEPLMGHGEAWEPPPAAGGGGPPGPRSSSGRTRPERTT
ncbi:helix-turn-helix transcriptional regulator [Nonomuraea longicatena]|uniref:HTH cro/C1-type domain-containing protein n=1 Tax=Nonomuraea longicatena TaxID=83682 RepID=A0ABP3ZCT4_9ACTN